MRQDITEKIEIPEGIECDVKNNLVSCKYEGRENKRKFNVREVHIEKKNGMIELTSKKATKKEMKILYTIKAHINNMFKGLVKGFEYKLEVAFVHFPMSVEYNEPNRELIIKNFLGEREPRRCKILEGVDVNIDGNIITLKSHDKEIIGQTAANIEKATRIKNKDRRKFQDGIYITEKPGRKI